MTKAELLILAQTDTTVGLLSQSTARLVSVKGRPAGKSLLRVVASPEALKDFVRLPVAHRAFVRRVEATTCLYPNGEALRVVHGSHRDLVARYRWLYSTSANPSGGAFDEGWASDRADIIIKEPRGFYEATPSRLLKLGKIRKKRLR